MPGRSYGGSVANAITGASSLPTLDRGSQAGKRGTDPIRVVLSSVHLGEPGMAGESWPTDRAGGLSLKLEGGPRSAMAHLGEDGN